MSKLRVLVIGGGLGGLSLAHGLLREGLDVAVHERDASAYGRQQGYRLRISPEGEQALRNCLPERHLRLLSATAAARRDDRISAYNEHLEPQWAPAIADPRPESAERIANLDRVTFRQVLLGGLDEVVRFGKRFTRLERLEDGRVTAHFADGTSDTGDVLVAADGAGSRVRAAVRPGDEPRDLGVRTIFARIPMARAFSEGLAEILRDRFTYVIGSDGAHLGLMSMTFRTPPQMAAEWLWPELKLEPAEDYFMGVFNVHRDEQGLDDEKFFKLSGAGLRDLVLDRTVGWHPALHGIFSYADPSTVYAVPLRAAVPVEPWEPGPVAGLGDAIHAMPPSGGVGANTAVRDADVLSRALGTVGRGEAALAEAIDRYQREMTGYANESVDLSLRIARWSMKKLDLEPPLEKGRKP